MIYRDGSIYEGEWTKGLKNGRGRVIYPDGSKLEGIFLENELIRLVKPSENNKKHSKV